MSVIRNALKGAAATAVVVGAAFAASTPVSAQAVWQAIYSIPIDNGLNVPGRVFMDDLNKACAAHVKVETKGDPEAVPVNEQMNAIKRGIVQMYFGAAGYYQGQVPGGCPD